MPAEGLTGAKTAASLQTTSNTNTNSTSNNLSVIDSTQSPEASENLNSSNIQNDSNNTISAAADSSDKQPSTPQPQPQLEQTNALNNASYPYSNNLNYGNGALLNTIYPQQFYTQANGDLQQQQQQQQLQQQQQQSPQTVNQNYPSYLNSYEQFFQRKHQQQYHQHPPPPHPHQHRLDFIRSNGPPSLFATTAESNKRPVAVGYPYVLAAGLPALNSQNFNASNNNMDNNSQTAAAPPVTVASLYVRSPPVSSSSPSSSNQVQISGGGSSIGSTGNPSSPSTSVTAGSPQCRKCGIMCTNNTELQEHITNVHGSSPYGSSGYASSPYIKEELHTPPQSQQQQQPQSSAGQQTSAQGVNVGEIFDLDSQKLLYSPAAGSVPPLMNNNLGVNSTDPLHGLHSMQQRAGINSWDQQSQEGMPNYLTPEQQQQQQSITEAKNLTANSPYLVNSNSNIMQTEHMGVDQQFISEKSFERSANNQQQPPQQQIMRPALSSSPTELASPTSTKAWKSNEPRRSKSYNCTACNKWFTSSGHLKRHYNTTLHKNAVKSSGQPDPATLPISLFHHPEKEDNHKPSRGRGSRSANSLKNNAQQRQQPPNPVQPPDPPNSSQDCGVTQVASAGLTPLSQYSATPSPTAMYQQQQQYQYMSTTVVSTQNAATMGNQQQLQQQQQQQQEKPVLNGHPNALAGLSVPTTIQQEQTPMPPSQMRGLLKTSMGSSTVPRARVIITKIEQLEAAIMEEQQQQQQQPEEESGYFSNAEMKREYSREMEVVETVVRHIQEPIEHTTYKPKDEDPESGEEELCQPARAHKVAAAHNVLHRHNRITQPIQQYQLESVPQEEYLYHNITSSNTPINIPAHSPLIISHPQYPAPPPHQQQHQMVAQGIFTITRAQQLLQQQSSIQEPQQQQQQYTNIPLVTNMPQLHNNMQQSQLIIMEQQQLPPVTTIPTINMANMLPLSPPHTLTELQPLATMLADQGPTNTSTPLHISTTTSNILPSYLQLQHPDSLLPQLEPMPNYPHNISGNEHNNLIYPDPFVNTLITDNQQTAVGQFMNLKPENGSSFYTPSVSANTSPTLEDMLPENLNAEQNSFYTDASSNTTPPPLQQANLDVPTTNNVTSNTKLMKNKRKTTPNEVNCLTLDDGRVRCLACKKEFAGTCYYTQHKKSFHYGKYPYRCETCGKRFQVETTYFSHVNKHKVTNKAHKCQKCPKQFHHKTDLRRHIDSIHDNRKPFACDICQKRFTRNDHLRKHKDTHNRPRVGGKKNLKNLSAMKNKTKAKVPLSPVKSNLKLNVTIASMPPQTNENSTTNQFANAKHNSHNNSNTLPHMRHYKVLSGGGGGVNEELLSDGSGEFEEHCEHNGDNINTVSSPYQQHIQSQYTVDNFLVVEYGEKRLLATQ